MKDEDKTKEQLMDELVEIRQRITELEASELQHRRVEEALRQSQQNYEAIVNSIDGIVWEADAQTLGFSFVSKQVERLLGYPVEHWLSKTAFWKNHIHPDDREWVVAFCVKAATKKREYDFEYRMIAADGRMVWLRNIVNVIAENDQPVKLRGLKLDITEQKRVEEELKVLYEDLNKP